MCWFEGKKHNRLQLDGFVTDDLQYNTIIENIHINRFYWLIIIWPFRKLSCQHLKAVVHWVNKNWIRPSSMKCIQMNTLWEEISMRFISLRTVTFLQWTTHRESTVHYVITVDTIYTSNDFYKKRNESDHLNWESKKIHLLLIWSRVIASPLLQALWSSDLHTCLFTYEWRY